MLIRLTKISDQRHGLEVRRGDGTGDATELVTREALLHDFIHFAVESTLPTARGFWGTLASGKSFADLNDRSGEATAENAEELYRVEGIVGNMTSVAQMPVSEALEKLNWFAESQGQSLPEWCTEQFVAGVTECVRRLLGEWKATPFGETMEVEWQEPPHEPTGRRAIK